MRRKLILSLVALAVGLSGAPQEATATDWCSGGVCQEWVARYDGPSGGFDAAKALAVDGSGSVYVAGYSDNDHGIPDYVTIKYGPDGIEEWVARYDSPASSSDYATAIALDLSGNAYVTGFSSGFGSTTIKYGPDGSEQWVARYANHTAAAVAVDGEGYVYVTGSSYSPGTSYDYTTVKFGPDGSVVWVARYDGPASDRDSANALAIDEVGNVYVTGYSDGGSVTSYDYATIKYGPDGVAIWVGRYDGPANEMDRANDVVVDQAGNVYVTGGSEGSGSMQDYATIKYGPHGGQRWVARYDGPSNRSDSAAEVAVDEAGNVYVTGTSRGLGSMEDYATIKYGPEGTQQWLARYDGPAGGLDSASGLALDGRGNVYVTGGSYGGRPVDRDYATVKYGTDGSEHWVARHDSGRLADDWTKALAVDVSGNVYATGYSLGSGRENNWVTIKYSPSAVHAEIDIKPGSPTNIINPQSRGTIPVAILTTAAFDAANVDPQTPKFEGAHAVRSGMKDVDHDSDQDLLLHFRLQDADLAAGQSQACLQGDKFDGVLFEGCDFIQLVPPAVAPPGPPPTATPPPANTMAVDARPGGPLDTTRPVRVGATFDVDVHITDASVPYAAYQSKLEFDPNILALDGHSYRAGEVFDLCASLGIGPDHVYSGCFLISGTTTLTGATDRITLRCIAEGVSQLHLLTPEDDPRSFTTTIATGAIIIPTTLSDAWVTCR